MARVFKATYSKLKTVKDAKGKTVYDVKNGKKVARREPVLGNDGKPLQGTSRKWYVEYRDADDIVRRVAGHTDRKATDQLASQLEREAAQRRTGLIDRHAEHRKRLLAEHLAEWHQALLAKGRTEHHAETQKTRVTELLNGCGFRHWADLSASAIQRHVASLREDKPRRRGISARTANGYVQAIKQFCTWMVQDNRAAESPLSGLSRYNEQADRRRVRRALTEEECRKLLTATEGEPERFGMTGRDRALLYRVALGTGLRANEIRSLTTNDFRLEGKTPTVTVRAAYSKHRREDTQPITSDLASELRAILEGRSEQTSLLSLPDKCNIARMLRADLKAAEIGSEDASGHRVDFHALRHTYISLMARAGVAPKVLMDLARHSDINLTMGYYSHTLVSDRAQALDALPDFNATPQGPERLAKTGTCDEVDWPTNEWESDKQDDKRDCDDAQPIGPCWIRTSDQWIMSPLL